MYSLSPSTSLYLYREKIAHRFLFIPQSVGYAPSYGYGGGGASLMPLTSPMGGGTGYTFNVNGAGGKKYSVYTVRFPFTLSLSYALPFAPYRNSSRYRHNKRYCSTSGSLRRFRPLKIFMFPFNNK